MALPRRPLFYGLLLLLLVIAAGQAYRHRSAQASTPPTSSMLETIKLPPGFHIDVYASNIPRARSLALGAKGTVFVGSSEAGRVYALVDRNHQNHAEVHTLASGLNKPSGVAFHDGTLYVAELTRVTRYDNIESHLDHPAAPVIINSSFPEQDDHDRRYIAFGPDGWLYIGVGAPCNICEPKDERFATLMRMHPDGSGLEIFARGIRNTVGFDWDPRTEELWFTDNGRDLMGDNIPPDELNHAPHAGMNFGYPYCHGGTIPDPRYGKEHSCSEFTPPEVKLPAHVAALGMRFYSGKMFPEEYKNKIFIAEHGSWNRSTPIGDRISVVGDRYQVFAEGWQTSDGRWGRPVDLLVMPDGALLVSDDDAGVVYRISYEKP